MDVIALVARIREHYIDQFVVFANKQKEMCIQGGPEIKFQFTDNNELYQRLYCVDFVRNDGKIEPIGFEPGYVLTFDRFEHPVGLAMLLVEHLRWDNVIIEHDAPSLPPKELSGWFRRWLDPDDERHDPNAPLSEIVHALFVYHAKLDIDFGTAPPAAFWEILELLEAAGAKIIRVSNSSDEASL